MSIKYYGIGSDHFVITPNDSVDLANTTYAIHANESGNINMQLFNSNSNSVFVVVAGGVYAYKVKKVFQTGTTANNIIGIL